MSDKAIKTHIPTGALASSAMGEKESTWQNVDEQ